jgi:hypothetical protein
MTVHIGNTDIFIYLKINFWTVLFWDYLILYQIDNTEISNCILSYLMAFCLCSAISPMLADYRRVKAGKFFSTLFILNCLSKSFLSK